MTIKSKPNKDKINNTNKSKVGPTGGKVLAIWNYITEEEVHKDSFYKKIHQMSNYEQNRKFGALIYRRDLDNLFGLHRGHMLPVKEKPGYFRKKTIEDLVDSPEGKQVIENITKLLTKPTRPTFLKEIKNLDITDTIEVLNDSTEQNDEFNINEESTDSIINDADNSRSNDDFKNYDTDGFNADGFNSFVTKIREVKEEREINLSQLIRLREKARKLTEDIQDLEIMLQEARTNLVTVNEEIIATEEKKRHYDSIVAKINNLKDELFNI